jgi:hypothetical protein
MTHSPEDAAISTPEDASQADETTSAKTAAELKPQPAWLYWVLPSIADIIFLALLCTVVFRPIGTGLLGDADTGWHIRNGENILATHIVPRTDPFSYTKAGQPWFAWEWLYDAGIAEVHHLAGLNGVALLTLILVCGTFAFLFQLILRRSGNLLCSVLLTLLAAGASQVHLLARPHVFSWLFCVLWLEILYRFEEGKTRLLLWLPPLMLLWVNIHGAFILGLALLGIFGCGALWRYLTAWRKEDLRKMGQLTAVALVCLAVTLLTPYGYQLHVHVYQYLSSSFLMNSIGEFQSPNFHLQGMGYFELIILLAFAGIAVAWKRLSVIDLLLVLFSLHAGLFAGRNIPIAANFMSLALAHIMASAISPVTGAETRPKWITALLETLNGVSESMKGMETQFKGHLLVIFIMGCVTAVALNSGKIRVTQVMNTAFSEKDFPVQATEFLAQKGVHSDLFSTDAWSGYLIYKLYPGIRLFFDDRHDFYGEAFIKEYVEASGGGPHWRQILDKYHVQWVLMPADSPLVSLLRVSPDWKEEYSDKISVILSRRSVASAPASTAIQPGK